MSASAEIIVQAKVRDLGDEKTFTEKFTDANTPESCAHGYEVIGSSLTHLSTLCNMPTSEILGVAFRAAASVIYFNTISDNISTQGGYLAAGQASYISLKPGNSSYVCFMGAASLAAIDYLAFGAAT